MKVIHVQAFVLEAHSWKDRPMRAVIGRVKIKPDRADEALAMIGEKGAAMLRGMTGSAGGYWARSHGGDIIQHSFWLFDTEENAPGSGDDLQQAPRHARCASDVHQRRCLRDCQARLALAPKTHWLPGSGIEASAKPAASVCRS
jgi:hypothetical protein